MSLNDVLIDEMRDLYSAENQQVKAGTKVVKQVSDPKLKELLTNHLEQTKGQVLRLREAFEHLGKKPTGKHCSGMEGCIDEIKEALEEDDEDALKDAGIVGATLRTEHYEIAGYTAALSMAKTLKQAELVTLLTESLREEEAAAKGILSAATSILKQAAAQEEDDDDQDEDEQPKDPEEQESERESEQDEQDAAPAVGSPRSSAPGSKKSAGKKSAPKAKSSKK